MRLLSTLLLGLLMTVAWTNGVAAQQLTTTAGPGETVTTSVTPGDIGMNSINAMLNANGHPDVVKPKSYYDALTYTWDNGDGQGLRTSSILLPVLAYSRGSAQRVIPRWFSRVGLRLCRMGKAVCIVPQLAMTVSMPYLCRNPA